MPFKKAFTLYKKEKNTSKIRREVKWQLFM